MHLRHLVLLALAGCTSNVDAPTNAPESYDLVVDDVHVKLSPSPQPVVIRTKNGAPPYIIKLTAAPNASGVDVTYVVVRMSSADDAAAMFEVLGMPPGVDAAPPKAVSPQRIEGKKSLSRGGEIVLGEGVWPDGEPYRVRLAAR